MKKIVYTSIDDFTLNKQIVKSYKELGSDFVAWIEENTIKLIENRTRAETLAYEKISSTNLQIDSQPFFMINGHSYFLDIYVPKLKLAIEIDGGYHSYRRQIDIVRDKDFDSIGIRTIRVSNKNVLDGNLFAIIREKLTNSKHVKKKKSKSPVGKSRKRELAEKKRYRNRFKLKYA
jgi:very-short-patch-repair endonuclease